MDVRIALHILRNQNTCQEQCAVFFHLRNSYTIITHIVTKFNVQNHLYGFTQVK